MTNDRLLFILSMMNCDGPELEEESGYFQLDRYAIDFNFSTYTKKKDEGGADPYAGTYDQECIDQITDWTFTNDEELIKLTIDQSHMVKAWLNVLLKDLEV